MAGRADYIINTIGKKHLICVKRTGRDAHYSEIASTTSEAIAGKIVEALNLHQRKKVEIESVTQRTLDDVRKLLENQRRIADDRERELRKVSRDLASMTDRAIKAERRVSDIEDKIRGMTPA